MIYFPAILSAVVGTYKKCPQCKKIQHFSGKKKGSTVTCKKCKHQFVLK